MAEKNYKYNILRFILFLAIWEVIFWIVASQLISVLGFFSDASKGEVLKFLYPQYLGWNIAIVGVLVLLFIYQMKQRNSVVSSIKNTRLLGNVLSPVSTKRFFYRYFLIRNALVFLIFAMAQPVFGTKIAKGYSTGAEMVFVIDISNSMNARDMKGGESRLVASKRAMNQLINQSAISRIGLLAFAGSTYPLLPLTPDVGIAKMYIDELNTSFISNQGTAIGAALLEAGDFFSADKSKKVLVLITDGEDHEGGIQEAYALLKENNIQVFILGIGTEQGGIVPKNASPNASPMRDDLGQAVVSKLNVQMLNELAKEIGGEVFITDEPFPNLSNFLIKINSKSETNIVDLEFEVKENRFLVPLTLALFMISILFGMEMIEQRNT